MNYTLLQPKTYTEVWSFYDLYSRRFRIVDVRYSPWYYFGKYRIVREFRLYKEEL